MINYVNVKDELVKLLKDELIRLNLSNIRVLKSDPKDAVEIPCIGINRISDDETNQVLNDSAGFFEDYDEVKGVYFNESYELRIWHSNAEERDKLYILLKAILIKIRKKLVEKGIGHAIIKGGRDEQENNFPPHPLYWATLTLTVLNYMEVDDALEPISDGEWIFVKHENATPQPQENDDFYIHVNQPKFD